MNILVLGGCGFIGSHIVDVLLARGHSVRVMARHTEKFRTPIAEIDYRWADFTHENELESALDNIDAVVHSLGSTVPGTSNEDPVADIENNLVGTVRLLEQLRKKKIERILFLSSGGTVYGQPEEIPVPESHPTAPMCSYAIVKLAIENYMLMSQQLYGLRPTIIRPSNLYGERQGHKGGQGAIAAFANALFTGESITVWGDGSIIRDYLHVKDLADFCGKVIESDITGVFNAGSGCGHSINEIIQMIFEVASNEVSVQYQKGRNFDIQEVVLDIQKAQKSFQWCPNRSLKQGIACYWQWFIENQSRL